MTTDAFNIELNAAAKHPAFYAAIVRFLALDKICHNDQGLAAIITRRMNAFIFGIVPMNVSALDMKYGVKAPQRTTTAARAFYQFIACWFELAHCFPALLVGRGRA